MFSSNGIRTILFDLDGTLRHSRPSFNQAFIQFAVQAGLPVEPHISRQALRWLHAYWAQSKELLADLDAYQDQYDHFWINHARLHLLACGCPAEQAEALAPQLHRRMAEEYQPEDWVPPEVPETLKALKEGGFTLGVVSNRTHSFAEQLETLGLLPYFDCLVAAGVVNAWKPGAQIFQHALRELGVQAGETVYVGDNYFADVIGAQNAGLRPVLLDPEGLFDEAGCPVIRSLAQLGEVLKP